MQIKTRGGDTSGGGSSFSIGLFISPVFFGGYDGADKPHVVVVRSIALPPVASAWVIVLILPPGPTP